jgi:glutamyl/glutaminyl-tRNA synthetase
MFDFEHSLRVDEKGDSNSIKPTCILRMDDTNPAAEKAAYVKGIVEDVEWLGFKYSRLTYTSDYFDELHKIAVELIY